MRVASNPYHIEGPLESGDAFIGREPIFQWIEQSLEAGETILALYGLPRIGKTSLLRQLPARLRGRYDCLCKEMPAGTALAPGFLASLQDELKEFPHALLLLDGLSLDAQPPEFWQALITALRNLGARILLAIQGHVRQLPAGSALAGIPAKQIPYLDEGETEELLARAAQDRLRYDYDAVHRIQLWGAGHPYLTQLFGYALFDYAGRYGRVDIHAAGKVVEQVLDAADGMFAGLWDALSPAAKITLSTLGEKHGRHDLFSGDDASKFLRWQGVEIAKGEVAQALDALVARGLLVKLGADSYKLEIELLRAWIERRKAVPEALREVRRYRQVSQEAQPERHREPIRWVPIFSWLLSILLILLIIWIWNTRDAPITPTPPSGALPGGTTMASTALAAAKSPTPLVTKLVAFASHADKDAPWRIFTMRSDGTELKQLTGGESAEAARYNSFSPAWSPDGKRILFVSDRSGNRDIWAMDADGKRPTNLTRQAADDWTPAWSRQGAEIAFSSFRDGNWEIYRMNADGSRQVRLTNHVAADVSPSWSPDGKWIVFASQRDGNWELYLMNREGGQLRRLTENEATDSAPAWSPKGDLIAFESYRDGNMEVYVIGADGQGAINLTREPGANDHGPAWSAQGDKLLYYSNLDGGWDIFVMNADGLNKRNLTRSEALEQGASWQP